MNPLEQTRKWVRHMRAKGVVLTPGAVWRHIFKTYPELSFGEQSSIFNRSF